MIEVVLTYDFWPGVDEKVYAEWAKKAIATILKQPGLVELRANRNILGTPQLKTTTVWKTFADYGRFAETAWPPLEPEMRKFVTNLRTEIWGPSPVIPQPLRPAK